MDFRRGKDNELRQMAKFLAEKAKTSGIEQNIGPLNAYERRLVHLAVAEIPASRPKASATPPSRRSRLPRRNVSLRTIHRSSGDQENFLIKQLLIF